MFEISTDTSLLRVNICGLIQPRSPPANQIWRNSALPARGGRAGVRGVGGWGRARLRGRELGFPASWPPPGAEGLCTFLRREKGLRLFFFLPQFSVPSINKPPELATFGPARGGRREGLGRGDGSAPLGTKMRTPSTSLAPFQKVSVAPRGTRSSCAVGGPARRTPQVQPRRTPGAAKGPRHAEEPEGGRGLRTPAPAQPVPDRVPS